VFADSSSANCKSQAKSEKMGLHTKDKKGSTLNSDVIRYQSFLDERGELKYKESLQDTCTSRNDGWND
jgi:hypothetical protein